MSQHVFIVMPFGQKQGINFNAIYQDLIKPALLKVGLNPFRADEESLPGDIRSDMFQELLMADLVIAELSIDNPNAWYELGVRHGLRARGVVQIRSNEAGRIPFDVCVDRTIHYHLKDGVPDPEFLDSDQALLGQIALETLRKDFKRRPSSPVYQYLPYLEEPNWKSLRVKNTDGFWQAHEEWSDLIEIARKQQKPGDILVLAEEAPTYALKLEAYRTAGNALQSLGHYQYALEHFEKALAINPNDLESAQKKGLMLGRVGRTAQAEQWLRNLSKKHPHDGETWALLGRTEKDCWIKLWSANKTAEAMFKAAKYESAQLGAAIQAYRQGFIEQTDSYFAGINALALTYVLAHLLGEKTDSDELKAMEGGIRWATLSALSKEAINQPDYWARVSLADLELLVSDVATIEKAYKYAVIAAKQDWFALDSTRQQLQLLQKLAFRPAEVSAALKIFDIAIARLEKPEDTWQPRKVFLFSGHMIDAPNREKPRFPQEKEPLAVEAIAQQLKKLGATEGDIAICGGACGGDLIFSEAALEMGLRLELRLPFAVPKFLQHSVDFAGGDWRERFYRVQSNPNTSTFIMPEQLGELAENSNPYERNNHWMLYSALAWGIDKVHCICLWNGVGGDGKGGTWHMHHTIKQRTGQVSVIDTHKLFKIKTGE
ncbi:MAG: DUF4071 domain-containing protein [Methyloprofundus sp.]|nr:DUF4071 domain-containing protein [Methyloprofundus sp.]